jgi:hypothetical protein
MLPGQVGLLNLQALLKQAATATPSTLLTVHVNVFGTMCSWGVITALAFGFAITGERATRL